MAKDWVGGTASTFKTIGASNHCDHDRQSEDYYATEPAATEWLTKLEEFSPIILEPSCGEGHISEALKKLDIMSQVATLLIEDMERLQTFSQSTIPNGAVTSLQILLISMHRSLWRKHCRLFQREEKSQCFSN